MFLCVSQSLNVGKVTQDEWISDTYITFLAVFSKIKKYIELYINTYILLYKYIYISIVSFFFKEEKVRVQVFKSNFFFCLSTEKPHSRILLGVLVTFYRVGLGSRRFFPNWYIKKSSPSLPCLLFNCSVQEDLEWL